MCACTCVDKYSTYVHERTHLHISKCNYGVNSEGIDSNEITGTLVDDVVSKAVRMQSSVDLPSMLNVKDYLYGYSACKDLQLLFAVLFLLLNILSH